MRGVYENPPGSNVWWINYYAGGKRHREKAGRKADALKLYGIRKADALAGRKLPELRVVKALSLGSLIDDMLERRNGAKSYRTMKSIALTIKKAIGDQIASELTPQELERWLTRNTLSAATFNRYRASLSAAYQDGVINGLIVVNTARLIRPKKELGQRLRFLTATEFDRVCDAIAELYPEHVAEFIVSVRTGMRLSEQYTVEWEQFHPDQKLIKLDTSKNGDGRSVHLSSIVIKAIEKLRSSGHEPTDRIFKRNTSVGEGKRSAFDNRWWFVPCLKKAKIKNYVWHSNRHTFCSWLAMAGASQREIMEAAGHKTIQMAGRYSHLSPKHQLDIIERVMG